MFVHISVTTVMCILEVIGMEYNIGHVIKKMVIAKIVIVFLQNACCCSLWPFPSPIFLVESITCFQTPFLMTL